MELSLRGTSNLEKLMRAVLLDADNKVPAERLRIVGALAEGAIIESGSNANGNWGRFANGLQICYGTSLFSFNTTDKYQEFQQTLPAAFADTGYACFAGHYSMPGTPMAAVNVGVDSTSTYCRFGFHSCSGQPPTTDTMKTIRWCVIGKWK